MADQPRRARTKVDVIQPRQRFIVGVTGASGAVYARHLLTVLREVPGAELHLVVSKAGAATIRHELGRTPGVLAELADVTHSVGAVGDSIASGSYPVRAMFVVPCSIRTLSAVATSNCSDLISRAADVCLKEGRPLVLMVRETPLHLGHLRLMATAAELGAVIAPPAPAFYTHPQTLDDMVDYTVRRLVSRAGITGLEPRPWRGLGEDPCAPEEPVARKPGRGTP